MFEAMVYLALFLFAALTSRLAAEVCNLEDLITEERREKYRKQAYAVKHREWTIRGNRRKLWESYTKENKT